MAAVQAELRRLSAEVDRLDQLAADRYGINRTDNRALDIISRAGGLTPKELAQVLGFTTGGVTTVIDRLEQAGYARRRPDANDRRRLLVEATALTFQRGAAIFGPLIRSTQELTATYSDAELIVIRDFLERSRLAIAEHGAALARDSADDAMPAAPGAAGTRPPARRQGRRLPG